MHMVAGGTETHCMSEPVLLYMRVNHWAHVCMYSNECEPPIQHVYVCSVLTQWMCVCVFTDLVNATACVLICVCVRNREDVCVLTAAGPRAGPPPPPTESRGIVGSCGRGILDSGFVCPGVLTSPC